MTSTNPTLQLERSNGGRIAYDIQGDGPLVLLAPGMGELRSTYRFLSPALVAAGYTVATTDLRGHGDSNTSFSEYGDAATADDIEALLIQLGRPATIVGNSMSAGSAVIVAARRPDLVSGLILIGPFVRVPKTSAAMNLLFRVMMARPWAVAAWKAYMPNLYAGKKPADFEEYRNAAIASMKRPGFDKAFALTTQTDHTLAGESLKAVSAPTLVVMGEKDPDFTSPQAEADWIADTLHADVAMIPDAGHYPHAQQPELTAAAIERFLATAVPRA